MKEKFIRFFKQETVLCVNLGGLGTLIASMASLISYKLIVREEGEIKGAYFRYFTLTNVCFLAVLLLFAFVYLSV